MVGLSVDDVNEANKLMEQRDIYEAQKAALAALASEDFTFKFVVPAATPIFGMPDGQPWSLQLLSGATPGSAEADAFDAIETIISDYLDDKIAEVDAALVAIGVTP